MFAQRRSKFETLENRLALAVTATVTDGDLVVQGDADGAVEIVAVGAGSYQVTDNGVVIADATTLTGVDDDIRIDIDESAGANNSVVLNLTDQTVDRVYAELGDGDNSLQLIGGTAASFYFRGGDGADDVDVGTNVSGSASVKLGDGDNAFTLTGSVARDLKVATGDGVDTISLAEGSNVDGSVKLFLGDGDNTADLAGAIGGSLKLEGLDGDDALTIAATATIADSLYARLGAGENTVTHNGSVGGDFSVVSKNANDVVNISDTAVIGGEQTLGLGEQQYQRGGGCHAGRGVGEETTGGQSTEQTPLANLTAGRGLGLLRLNGMNLGFFLRGFGR